MSQAKPKRDLRAALPVWRNRILWAAALGLFGFGVAEAGHWLHAPSNLPVRAVRVQGDLQQIGREELRAAVEPFVDSGILWLDVAAVRASVEALPWVRRAAVRRAWPDAVLVEVEERRAIARWADGGLISHEGVKFVPQRKFGQALPVLTGPTGTEAMVTEGYLQLEKALDPVGLDIARVSVDARRAWRIAMTNGVEVVLGRDRHEARLARFLGAWPRILGPRVNRVARVDLRYANGFAVSWREAG